MKLIWKISLDEIYLYLELSNSHRVYAGMINTRGRTDLKQIEAEKNAMEHKLLAELSHLDTDDLDLIAAAITFAGNYRKEFRAYLLTHGHRHTDQYATESKLDELRQHFNDLHNHA